MTINLGKTRRHAKPDGGVLGRVAIEVERLRAENARLREALNGIVELVELDDEAQDPSKDLFTAVHIAKDALRAGPSESTGGGNDGT